MTFINYIYITWVVGHHPSLHQPHITQHHWAIMQYGQEGLNATVLPTHTIMEIKNIIKFYNAHVDCT